MKLTEVYKVDPPTNKLANLRGESLVSLQQDLKEVADTMEFAKARMAYFEARAKEIDNDTAWEVERAVIAGGAAHGYTFDRTITKDIDVGSIFYVYFLHNTNNIKSNLMKSAESIVAR